MKKHVKTGSAAVLPPSEEPAPKEPAAGMASLTFSNLQTAYRGEINAHARYLAFAREADEEGYSPVASLFRAAARSEEIHAKNHLEAIVSLGGSAAFNPEPPVVRSTYDNLEAAITVEVYERDEMYPAFLHQARVDKSPIAARTFHLAQKAESEHAALFTEAKQQLGRLRGEAITYYVCPVCGFTSTKANHSRCPVCSTPSDRFIEVS